MPLRILATRERLDLFLGLDQDRAVGAHGQRGAQRLLRLGRADRHRDDLGRDALFLEAHRFLDRDLVERVHAHLDVGEVDPRAVHLDPRLDVVIDHPFDGDEQLHVICDSWLRSGGRLRRASLPRRSSARRRRGRRRQRSASPDSARMFLPSSTLVPSSRTTSGSLSATSRAAATMPFGDDVAAHDPAEDVDEDALHRSGRERMILNAAVTFSFDAPPPTSRKLAGSPPDSLMMSIVAMARPAPLTMQPILPSSLM